MWLLFSSWTIESRSRGGVSPEGYTVLEANRAADALEKAREHRPDVVIIDVKLPDMTGSELLKHIKDDPRLSATKALFYTAFYDDEDIAKAIQVSGCAVLKKPVTDKEIIRQVDAALK
ncbi:MAG: response regulator [Syntrophorhabdales bacterium]|jgi:CheY-like chemotaxis protein